MRVLVTGSRSKELPASRVHRVLTKVDGLAQEGHVKPTLVVGCCPTGADAHALAYALEHGWNVERYSANWRRDGERAGPDRNQRMVDSGADVCIAFPMPESRGTWDCIRRARAAGIFVEIIHDCKGIVA